MRPHQLTVLLAFLFLGYLATADAGIDRDDVKRRECWDVCRPIVKWSIDCDIEYGDSDPAELNCVCSRANAATLIPLCEACISTYDDDGHHNGMLYSLYPPDIYLYHSLRSPKTDSMFRTLSFLLSLVKNRVKVMISWALILC